MARDLRLFYLFRLLATSYLWVPVFVHFMQARGLGFDEILSLAAIYSAVVILVEIPTGALADRIGRRTSMMLGALAMVASCLIAYQAHSFAGFAVAEIFAAASISLCSGADSAYLFDLLSSDDRTDEYPRSEGTASAAKNAGSAIAFAAGGLLGEIDLALPYLATAAVAAVAFLIALALSEDDLPERPRAPGKPIAAELGDYLRLMGAAIDDVRRSSRLLWIIAFSAVVFMLLKSTLYLYQPYLEARDFGIAETGLVFSGVYLIATLVSHNVERLRRRFGEAALVWGVLATLAASFVLLNQFAGPLGAVHARRPGRGHRHVLAAGQADTEPSDHRLGAARHGAVDREHRPAGRDRFVHPDHRPLRARHRDLSVRGGRVRGPGVAGSPDAAAGPDQSFR